MINRSRLSVSEVAALDQYEISKKHLAQLEALVSEVKELSGKELPDHSGLEDLLTDIKAYLEDIKDREDPKLPEFPDYAKPIVSALTDLKQSLAALPAPQVDVAAPNVTVDAPDLSALEKALKAIPKALEAAIASMPVTDHSDMVDRLDAVLTQLADIDIGVRLKPQFPNVLKVTNPDGSSIQDQPKTTRIAVSGALTWVGRASAGSSEFASVWQIQRIDETSGTVILWADGNINFDNVWTNYAALTYT